jgi:phospholipid transport system substrate-binding protein
MYRRRLVSAGAIAVAFAICPFPALAASIAEDFIANNIHLGFDILNDRALSAAQRKERFASFVIGLTDVRRVALFLLGPSASNAPAEDIDAYVVAYQDYLLAVYQSYFSRYAGESLRVLDSRERSPSDFVVRTNVVGLPGDAQSEIDFRVVTDRAKPAFVDICIGGLWLAVAQRDEFGAVLAQSGGDLKPLIAQLRTARARFA